MRSGFFRHFRDIWEQYEDKEARIYTDQGTPWADSAGLKMCIKYQRNYGLKCHRAQ